MSLVYIICANELEHYLNMFRLDQLQSSLTSTLLSLGVSHTFGGLQSEADRVGMGTHPRVIKLSHRVCYKYIYFKIIFSELYLVDQSEQVFYI